MKLIKKILVALLVLVAPLFLIFFLSITKYHDINLMPPPISLMSAIEEFEKTRNDIATEINLIVCELIVKSNSDESNLYRISVAWKEGWNNIYDKLNKLENDYSKIEKESKVFFLILELEKNRPIFIRRKDWFWFGKTSLFIPNPNPNLYKANDKIKESWASILGKTATNINQLKSLVRESLDLYKILSFSTTQDEFVRSIEELKIVSKRIQTLSSSLKYLVNGGQKLAEPRSITVELIPIKYTSGGTSDG